MKLDVIYNEDCLEGMDKRLPDDSIDLTITSPPYDNLRKYSSYIFDFEPIAQELYRVTRDGGVVIWVVGDATINGSETGTSFRQALYFKKIGFNLHDTMIYNRYAQLTSKVRYSQDFEYIFVLSKKKSKTINLIKVNTKPHGGNTSGTRNKNGTIKYRTIKRNKIKPHSNIWQYNRGNNHSTKDKIAYKHPAIFPEKLAEDNILSWSNEGDIILDPMFGSGTTLKMAKRNSRYYIGFEINPEYCKIANKRLENLQPELVR